MKEKTQNRIGFKVKVINPRGMEWCSLEVAREIQDWIVPESRGELANMLYQEPEDLLRQMEKGFTFLAILGNKVVGHITLWKYQTVGWSEVGSLIIDLPFRGQGIGKILTQVISESFQNFQLTATAKTEPARRVFLACGFKGIPFDKLKEISESAWRECCPCYSPPELCPKREGGCKLLIRGK